MAANIQKATRSTRSGSRAASVEQVMPVAMNTVSRKRRVLISGSTAQKPVTPAQAIRTASAISSGGLMPSGRVAACAANATTPDTSNIEK